MRVVVLGSGCSWGTPKLGCSCKSCERAKQDHSKERLRFSLLLETGNKRFLIDASPDLRKQLNERDLGPKDIDGIFITHSHYDHVSGLREFTATGRDAIPCYTLESIYNEIYAEMGYLFKKGTIKFSKLEYGLNKIAGMDVNIVPLNHSRETIGFIFNVENKKIGVATDTSLPSADVIQEYRDSDILFVDMWAESKEKLKKIYDTMGKKYNGTANHMYLDETKQFCSEARVKNAIAIHICHLAEFDGSTMDWVKLASDGMVVQI